MCCVGVLSFPLLLRSPLRVLVKQLSSHFHLHLIFIPFLLHFHFMVRSLNFSTLLREGVCVSHLKRCKTSTADFIRFYSLSCRGAVNLIPSTAQRRGWFEIVISGLIIPTYLQISNFHFVVNGNRLSPESACRSFAGFLVLLHCCRNLYFSAANRGRTTWFRWISCF